MAAPKKSKSAAKKTAAKKSAAKSQAAKKSAAKKTAAKKTVAKKTPVKKAAAKKAAAKKTPAKKTAVKKTPAKKTAAKKTPVKKTPVKKTAAKKTTPVKKTAPVKESAVKKTAAKKTPAKKVAAAKSAAPKKSASSAAKKSAAKTSAAKKAAVKKNSSATSPETPKPKQIVPPKPTPKPKKSNSALSPLLSNDVPEQVEIPKPRGTSKDGITYTKDFDVKFLKAQRDELLARRASELARATRLEDEATSIIEDGEMGDVQFDDEGGEGDTMVVQRDLDRLLSGQARQTVADIDEALARIEAGTYGYSVVSGKPIPRERLEAIPETTVLAVEKVSGAGFR